MTENFWPRLKALKSNPVALLLLSLFIIEGLTKYCFYQGWEDLKLSAGFKLLLQVFFVVQIIRKTPNKLWLIAGLIAVFFAGQLTLVDKPQLLENLIFLDRYLFVLLMLLYVNSLNDRLLYVKDLFWVFEWLIIINSALVLLGFFTDIYFLETYTGKRAGHNGLLLRSGASSYIYWIALFYWTHQLFILKKRKILSFILVIAAALLLGTKSIILAFLILPFYLFFALKWYQKKWIVLATIALLISSYFLFIWGFDLFISSSESLRKIVENEGFVTAFFSYRDVHLVEEMIPSIKEHWQWNNYLFGGGYNMHFRSQFGLLDMFYFFGIAGTGLYLFAFGKSFIGFSFSWTTVFFMAGTVLLLGLGGNFFYETIVAIYVVLIKLYFEQNAHYNSK